MQIPSQLNLQELQALQQQLETFRQTQLYHCYQQVQQDRILAATTTVVSHTVSNVESFFIREQLLGGLSQLQSDKNFFEEFGEELQELIQQQKKKANK